MNLNHQLKSLLINIYHGDADAEYVENWLGTYGAEVHSSDSELDRRIAGELEYVVNEQGSTDRSVSLVETASMILQDIGLIGASIINIWTPEDGNLTGESNTSTSSDSYEDTVVVGVQDSAAWAEPIIV